MNVKLIVMRKYWVDNLRWVTVLLVLLYHVVYFYNNKGVFGGIGGFGTYPDCPQYQDVLMYVLYPWFMPLLFLLAGMSARYALERHSGKEWFHSRTRKLLVPSTVGLLVFQWMTGYFNTQVAPVVYVFTLSPQFLKRLLTLLYGHGIIEIPLTVLLCSCLWGGSIVLGGRTYPRHAAAP